jgi:hypothetical protein
MLILRTFHDREAKRAELLLLQLNFLPGGGRRSSGHKSRQNRLVPDMPPLQVKVGLLYFTDGAIRELVRTKNERTLAGQSSVVGCDDVLFGPQSQRGDAD